MSEEEFLNFYTESLSEKTHLVWENLKKMNYREDLKKRGEPYPFDYAQNDKLPGYLLGND